MNKKKEEVVKEDPEFLKYKNEKVLLKEEKNKLFDEIKLVNRKLDLVDSKLKPFLERKMAKNIRHVGKHVGKLKANGSFKTKNNNTINRLKKGVNKIHSL